MKSATTRLALTTILLSLTLSTACFQGSEGESGNFTFYDNTREPGDFLNSDRRIDRPLAAGATMRVRLQDGNTTFRPTAAESSDPDVLRVDTFFDSGVVVEGVAPGEARLTVRRGEVEDSIVIDVAAVGQTVVHLYPVGELAEGVKGLDTTDVVMTPRARIWGFVEQRGTDGQALTGFGATPCTVDATEAAILLDDDSDSFTLDAAEDEGEISLHCGATELILPVSSPDVAVRLSGYDYFDQVEGLAFGDIDTGARLYLVVLAYDEQDRVVQNNGAEAASVVVPEEHEMDVTVVQDSGSEELDALLTLTRTLTLEFARPGDYALTIEWNGLASEMSFSVKAQ